MITKQEIQQLLIEESSEENKRILQRFFKTGKGEYGEGDIFRGVKMPHIHAIVKYVDNDLNLQEMDALLQSPFHEDRMAALLILVKWFEASKRNPKQQDTIFEFYLRHTKYINNWDLVDLSAPKIVGVYLLQHPSDVLFHLAESDNLWEQRIAVVSTWKLIQQGEFNPTMQLAEKLLHHPHDLMQKAIGWMLREIGKRDLDLEIDFLLKDGRYKTMPRTMLRYAIEKFPESLRLSFLHGEA